MAVIGSAEVVIRAVTTGIKEQISRAIRDARAGAKSEGQAAGKDYSDGFGNEVSRGMPNHIGKAMRDSQSEARSGGQQSGRDYSDGFGNEVSRSMPRTVKDAMSGIDLNREGQTAGRSFGRGMGDGVENEAERAGDRAGSRLNSALSRSAGRGGGGGGNIISKLLGGDFGSKIEKANAEVNALYRTAAFTGTRMAALATGISSAAGALFTLAAAAAQAAPAIAVLPGLLSAVAQAGAVIGISMKGVGKAISAGLNPVAASTAGAGKSAITAARQAAASAERIENAQERVRKAYKAVDDAVKKAAEVYKGIAKAQADSADAAQEVKDRQDDLAAAYEEAGRRSADALDKVTSAEQDLADAQRDVRNAQLALNDARAAGIEQLQQLGFRAEDAALAEERAAMKLEDAQAKLVEAQKLPPGDIKGRKEADLAFREAELNYREAKDRAQDLAKEQKAAAKKGIEGTSEVINARKDIANAEDKAVDSAKRLKSARQDQADAARQNTADIKDAKKAIEDANKAYDDSVDKIAKAKDAYLDAKDAINEANIALRLAKNDLGDAQSAVNDFGDSAAAAAPKVDAYADALKKLSPHQQEFVKLLVGDKKIWSQFQNDLAEPIFTALIPAYKDFTKMVTGPDGLKSAFVDTAEIVGTMITQITDVITTGEGLKLFKGIMDGNNAILGKFTEKVDGAPSALENLITVLLRVGEAVQPLTLKFAGWIAGVIEGWAKIDTKTFEKFFTRAGEFAAEFGRLFGAVFDTINTLILAAGDPAKEFVHWLGDGAKKMSDMAKAASGDGSLTKYFQDTVDNMKPVIELLAMIVLEFLKLGKNDQIGDIADALKPVVPILGDIISHMSDAGPALADFVISVVGLLDKLTAGDALDKFFDVLTKIVDLIADVAGSQMGQAFLRWVAPIHAISRAFGLVFGIIGKFGPALFAPLLGIKKLGGAVGGLFKGAKAGFSKGGFLGAITGGVGGLFGGGKGKGKGKGGFGGDDECECPCPPCPPFAKAAGMGGDCDCGGQGGGLGQKIMGSKGKGKIAPDADQLSMFEMPGADVATKKTGFFSKAMGGLGKSFKFVGGLFKTLAPLLGILIPLFVSLYKNNDKFREAVDKIIAVLGELVSKIMTFLMPVIEALMPLFDTVFKVIGDAVAALLPILMPVINAIVDALSNILLPAVEWVFGILGPILTTAFDGLQWVFDNVLTPVIGFITGLLQGIPAMVQGVVDWLRPIFEKMFEGLSWAYNNVVKPYIDFVWAILDGLWRFVQLVADILWQIFKLMFKGLIWVWNNVVKPYVDFVVGYFKFLWSIIQEAVDIISPLFKLMFAGLTWVWNNVIKPVIGWILGYFEDLWEGIKEVVDWITPVIKGMFDGLDWAWKNVVKPVIKWIEDALHKIPTTVQGVIDLVSPIFKKMFDAFTKVYDEVVAPIFKKIKDGFENIPKVIEGIKDGVSGAWKTVVNFMVSPINKFIDAINWVIDKINSVIKFFGGTGLGRLDHLTTPYAEGGLVKAKKYAQGGSVGPYNEGGGLQGMIRGPGGPKDDKILARLSNGEFVMSAAAVKRYGRWTLEAINKGTMPVEMLKYSTGPDQFGKMPGMVPPAAGLLDWAKKMVGKIGDWAKEGVAKGLTVGLEATVGPMMKLIPETGFIGGLLHGAYAKIKDMLMGWAKGKDDDRKDDFAAEEKKKAEEAAKSAGSGAFALSPGGWPGPVNGGLSGNAAAASSVAVGMKGVGSVGGFGYRPLNPGSDHSRGKAIDIMINDWPSPNGIAAGNQAAQYFMTNAKTYGVKYVIWRAKFTSGHGWGPYTHPSGATDPTNMHMDHVHVSFFDKGGILDHMGFAANTSGRPERILTPNQTVAFDTLVSHLTASGGGGRIDIGRDGLSSRDRALIQATADRASGGRGDVNVRVFIGERELLDIVDTEINYYDAAVTRAAITGRKFV